MKGTRVQSLWVRRIPWRRQQLPTPIFLPVNPQGQEAWQAIVYGVARVGHKWAISTHISIIFTVFIKYLWCPERVFFFVVCRMIGLPQVAQPLKNCLQHRRCRDACSITESRKIPLGEEMTTCSSIPAEENLMNRWACGAGKGWTWLGDWAHTHRIFGLHIQYI